MTSSQLEAAALLAMIAALPLVSWGTTDDITVATTIGTLLLVVGLATLTAMRFVDVDGDADG